MDYKLLLEKYMRLVVAREGESLIDGLKDKNQREANGSNHISFSNEEIEELKSIDKDIK